MPTANTTNTPNRLEFDVQEFMHYLDDTDLTDQEKREMIDSLWVIKCEFVALGFEVRPAKQAENACGKHSKNNGERASPSHSALYCKQSISTDHFNHAGKHISDPA